MLFVYVTVPSPLSVNVTPVGKLAVFQTVAPLGLTKVALKVIVLPNATVVLSCVEITIVVAGLLLNVTAIAAEVTELFVAVTENGAGVV
jgi:hypothetical protein